MLKKPRRGWYAMPGGKMEQGETIKESVVREYWEETGLELVDPKLMGAFTFLIKEQDELIQEWMMFTFMCHHTEGSLVEECDEGELEWVHMNEVLTKPMAEGDRHIYSHVLTDKHMMYGKFTYTSDYQLIDYSLDRANS